jgi:hypothetical protein
VRDYADLIKRLPCNPDSGICIVSVQLYSDTMLILPEASIIGIKTDIPQIWGHSWIIFLHLGHHDTTNVVTCMILLCRVFRAVSRNFVIGGKRVSEGGKTPLFAV